MSDDVNKIEITDDEEQVKTSDTSGSDSESDEATSSDTGNSDADGDANQVDDASDGDDVDLEPAFDQAGFQATKNLIQSLSVQLDELTIQQREFKERLKNILENDAQLSEFEAAEKDAKDAVKKRKKDLMDSVEAKEVKARIAEMRDEAKEIKESLTHHLLNYYQVTGTQSFETPAGDEREFSFSARIKKPKK